MQAGITNLNKAAQRQDFGISGNECTKLIGPCIADMALKVLHLAVSCEEVSSVTDTFSVLVLSFAVEDCLFTGLQVSQSKVTLYLCWMCSALTDHELILLWLVNSL